MKQLIVALLLLVATPAFAGPGPTFVEEIGACVDMTVVYTEFAVLANQTSDKDKPQYVAYIELQASKNNPTSKQIILHLGAIAWAARGTSVRDGAMELYQQCFDSTGIHT